MELLANPDFWNDPRVIKTQSQKPNKIHQYEEFLINESKKKRSIFHKILCVGAGTGREVYDLHLHFPDAKITANDIAENMIIEAISNFEKWGISKFTDTVISPIEELHYQEPEFDFVSLFNNMLNYITPSQKREKAFNKIYQILKPNGVIVGVVHNIVGTPQKTGYFVLSRLMGIFGNGEFGDRVTGWEGKKCLVHYFSSKQLFDHLNNAGFQNINIYSLQELSKMYGKSYNRLKGDNNMVFIANK